MAGTGQAHDFAELWGRNGTENRIKDRHDPAAPGLAGAGL
jgi:hypothetical protein